MANEELNIFGRKQVITWAEAQILIFNYCNDPYKHVTTAHGSSQKLEGFSFPIAELQNIINQAGVKEVYFAIAYHDIANPEIPNALEGYTLVMVGVDNQNNVMNQSHHLIYDYCNPCPPVCPNGI